MKENFFNSMLMENGKISSKRVISFMYAVMSCVIGAFVVYKDITKGVTVFGYFLIGTGVMTGVTTIPQIVGLIRGGSAPVEPVKEEPKTDNNEQAV